MTTSIISDGSPDPSDCIQETEAYPENPLLQLDDSLLFQLKLDGDPVDIEVEGNIAYILTAKALDFFDLEYELVSVNISNPSHLDIMDNITFSQAFQYNRFDLVVRGNVACIGKLGYGLCIIDVSNPSNLSILYQYDSLFDVHSLEIVGNIVYLAGNTGVETVNISIPSSPSSLGFLNLPENWFRRIKIEGYIAYVHEYDFGLRCIDISNPVSPVEIGAISFSGRLSKHGNQGLSIHGNIAYVLTQSKIIKINIGQPSNPTIEWEFSPDLGTLQSFEISGNILYLSSSVHGIHYFDLSEAHEPSVLGTLPFNFVFYFFKIHGNIAFSARSQTYLGSGNNLLYSFPITAPLNCEIIQASGSRDITKNLDIAGDVLYFADGTAGIRCLDISNPLNPIEMGDFDTTNDSITVKLEGNVAYELDDQGWLHCLDVSDPFNPTALGELYLSNSIKNIEIEGNIAYVAAGDAGVGFINISDPSSPYELGWYDSDGEAFDIEVIGDMLYLADGSNGFLCLNISNPSNPSILGKVNALNTCLDLEIAGNVAFIAEGAEGLRCVDIEDPLNPLNISHFDTDGTAYQVKIEGDIALVADGVSGIFCLNISDLTQITTIFSTLNTTGTILSVSIYGQYAYIAAGDEGLWVWKFLQGTNDDYDEDGLGFLDEANQYLTDPNNYDTDGDLMPDGWEVNNNLNPNFGNDDYLDGDYDLLENVYEFQNGTDPWDPDCDGDNLLDGEELNPPYNTNPLNNDTDFDGMPDDWEIFNELDPLINDRLGDPDGDNLSNLDEFLSDTDPQNEDTDNDGVWDLEEIEKGFDPTDPESYPRYWYQRPLIWIGIIIGAVILSGAPIYLNKLLPWLQELTWREKIELLLVLEPGGIPIYQQTFNTKFEETPVGVVGGALVGISSIVNEITNYSDLETIKQKEYCIMLEKGTFVRVAIMSTQELDIIRKKMRIFLDEFEESFIELLQNFSGNISVFSPTKSLVKNYFDLQTKTPPFAKKMEKILTKNHIFIQNLKKRLPWMKSERSKTSLDNISF